MGNQISGLEEWDCCGARDPTKIAKRDGVKDDESVRQNTGKVYSETPASDGAQALPDADIKRAANKQQQPALRATVLRPAENQGENGDSSIDSSVGQQVGKSGGVGLMFVKHATDPKKWVVRSVIKNSPAWNSNRVRESDVLVSVDGVPAGDNQSLSDLSKMLMGAVGSVIVLRFIRDDNSQEQFDVPLTRSDTFTGEGSDKKRVWQATRTVWAEGQAGEDKNVSL